jgi:predicted NAD/FAD-dependent oxidoreductase
MLAFAYHPVQYFTARDPVFQAMVQQWESNGAVRRWEGPVVGTLQDGVFAPDDASSSGAVRYVGNGGMRRLAQYLASQASSNGAPLLPLGTCL